MKADILIKNGLVIDPYKSYIGTKTIGISENRMADLADAPIESLSAETVIDAAGCVVMPGLIDFHTHLFYGGSELGAKADLMLPTGVTSAVDAGTAGCLNYEAFRTSALLQSSVRIKSFISASTGGLYDLNHHPVYDPGIARMEKIRALKERYPDEILGIKVMLSRGIVGDDALPILRSVIKTADQIGNLAVCVHTTDPGCPAYQIARELRKGDIYCHCYQGSGSTILDSRDKVHPEVWEARRRGVLFDAANGKGHFCNHVAEMAMQEGFFPDIISTDIVRTTLYASRRAKNLPYVLSKYLNLGMELSAVIRAASETPAKIMRMEGQIGTLVPGALADIAIARITQKHTEFMDFRWNSLVGDKLLIPQLTILNGEIVYSQTDFVVEHE